MPRLKPMGEFILVEPIQRDNKFAGGELILPEKAVDPPQYGTVRAVGPGVVNQYTGARVALDINVNDQVLFTKYGGTEIKDPSGSKLLLMRSSDILAVVEP